MPRMDHDDSPLMPSGSDDMSGANEMPSTGRVTCRARRKITNAQLYAAGLVGRQAHCEKK